MNAMKVGIDQLFSGTFESFLLQKKSRATTRVLNISDYFVNLFFAVYTTEDKHLSFIFLVFKSDIHKKKHRPFFFWGNP